MGGVLSALGGAGDRLGIAVVEIGAEMKGYEKGVDTAEKKLKTFDEKSAKTAKRIGLAMTAAGTAVVSGMLAAVNSVVKFGDEIDKASLRTSVSAETLSALAYAADISGTSFQQMEGSLRRLAANMDEASKGTGDAAIWFEKLGLQIRDTEGKMRPITDVFLDAADAIAKMDNETEQVVATQEVFGARFGTQILPLLKQGSSGIMDLADRAGELGLVLSTDAAKAAAEFKDRMTDLKGSLAGITRSIGSNLMPTLLPLVKQLTDVSVGVRKWSEAHPELNQRLSTFGLTVGGLTAVGGPLILLAPHLLKARTALKTLGLTASTTIPLIGGLALATWGLAEAINYYQKPIDRVALHHKVVAERTKVLNDAIDKLSGSLAVYGQTGDETAATLGDLEVNTKQLSKELGIMVDENMNAANLLARLEAAFFRYVETNEKAAKKTKATTDAIEDFNEAVAATPWEQVTQKFQDWSDITGAGYQANLLTIRDYWRDRLAEAEAGSQEELAIQRTIADTEAKLADERYASWMVPARKVATERPLLLEQTKDRELQIVQTGEDGKRKLIGWSLTAILQLGKEFSEKWLKDVQERNQKELQFTQNMIALREQLAAKIYDYDIYAANLASDIRQKERTETQKQQEWRENYVVQGAEKIIAEKEKEFQGIKHLYDNEKEYNLARKIAYIDVYDDMIEAARTAGMDITALEEYRNERLAALTETGTATIKQGLTRRAALHEQHWHDYIDITATGVNASANLWADMWEVWHNTEMTADKFYSSSIGKLATWVDRVSSLLNNARTAWNSLNTVIAGVGKLLGITGGGGTVSALAQAAPGVGTGTGILSKIWGGAKGAAGTVAGLPWGSIAGTAAGLAPAAAAGLFTAGVFGFMGKGIWDMFTSDGKTTGMVEITRTQEEWNEIWRQQARDDQDRYNAAARYREGQEHREQMQLELAQHSVDELRRIYQMLPNLRPYINITGWTEERGIAGGRYGRAIVDQNRSALGFWVEFGNTVDDATKSTDKATKSTDSLDRSVNQLTDDLAGHSLTTALNDVGSSVKNLLNEYPPWLSQQELARRLARDFGVESSALTKTMIELLQTIRETTTAWTMNQKQVYFNTVTIQDYLKAAEAKVRLDEQAHAASVRAWEAKTPLSAAEYEKYFPKMVEFIWGYQTATGEAMNMTAAFDASILKLTDDLAGHSLTTAFGDVSASVLQLIDQYAPFLSQQELARRLIRDYGIEAGETAQEMARLLQILQQQSTAWTMQEKAIYLADLSLGQFVEQVRSYKQELREVWEWIQRTYPTEESWLALSREEKAEVKGRYPSPGEYIGTHITVNINAGNIVADEYSAREFAERISQYILKK